MRQYAATFESGHLIVYGSHSQKWGLGLRPVLKALVLGLSVCMMVAGCQSDQDQAPGAQTSMLKMAPPADARRVGVWQGGPEPVSGKLHSGIAVYYQVLAPVAGKPFDLVLRFEGVTGEDGAVQLSASDGVRLVADAGGLSWRLGAGLASQLVVKVIAQPGDSYVHLLTSQNGRHTARSIALSLPSTTGKRAAGYRGGDDKDASGEPIVRMQAQPQK